MKRICVKNILYSQPKFQLKPQTVREKVNNKEIHQHLLLKRISRNIRQSSICRHQTSLKYTIARQASLRSAGDGESTEFVSDETILKDSLHEEESNEKKAICDEKGKQERNSANIVVLET